MSRSVELIIAGTTMVVHN